MIAASVFSTAALEIYPLGFLSIGEYLERHGYHVAICNLALLSSVMPRLRPEAILRRMRARMVGIDLHWAAHTDGLLELAHIIKSIHPGTHIVVGGLTASGFWRELLNYPEIDFVMRGDSTEYPLLCLMNALKNGSDLENVPNLAWRDKTGSIRTTGLEWVPDDIDDYRTDYSWVIRSAARHLNPVNVLMSVPYRDWLMNPSAAVLTQRGCPNSCLICGGSAHAYREICNRKRPAVRSPAAVIRDVASAARIMRSRIFLGSDMQDPGDDYYREIFRRFKALCASNPLVIEVMRPAPLEFFQAAVEATGSVTLHMSAESHDEALRMRFGRKYTNATLEQMIGAALSAGIRTVRIFFGIGLPGQDAASVMKTVDYCGQLLERFGRDGRFFPFISILAPFIEPGSRAFSNPERHGYKNLHSTLEDYRDSMRQRSWLETMGYETFDMDRVTLVRTTYKANIALNRLLEKHNLITARNRRREEERLKREWHMVEQSFTTSATGIPAYHVGQDARPTKWLVGESSIYTSKVRGFLIKPHAFRPLGILGEACVGLRGFLRDSSAG
jgi:B12-binding domain/radical SAM domain protein